MKRILLVDDDFLALNAFFTLADWGQYGLSIAYEAHNGQEALDYLSVNRPDIVFIDVYMPDMDGISLLRKIRKQDPSILCIMLSSYSDYPYVREAMKHGAADYLLKHEITRDSVLALLSQYGVDTTPSLEAADTETRLLKLFTEHLQNGGALSGLMAYGYLTEGRVPIKVQLLSIHQTCRHILNDIPDAAVCSPTPNELVILFCGDVPESLLPEIQEHVSSIKKALQKYHHTAYAFAPLKHCMDAAQADYIYQLYHREYMQDAVIARSSLTSEENMSLMLAVVNHQKTLIANLIHVLYANAQAKRDVDGFAREMMSLFLHLKQLLGISGDTLPRLPGEADQLEPFVTRLFMDLSDYDGAGVPGSYSQTTRQALDYLHQHYADNIHLNDIAKHCSVSYNHLSFLFKKETGENIISYLNRLRVYYAARLILFDSMPASAVCERVGFNCYNHFFSTFRSFTGMAPSEFRKNTEAVEWMVKFSRVTQAL